MTVDPNSSLADPRYEAFAQAIAREGRGGGARAYRAHIATRAITHDSAKSSAWMYARRSPIAERIVAIRAAVAAESAPAPEPLTSESVAAVLVEVTNTLAEIHDVAQRQAADPPILTRLRRALSAHSGRLGYLSTETLQTPAPQAAPGGPSTLPAVPDLPPCSCSPAGRSGGV